MSFCVKYEESPLEATWRGLGALSEGLRNSPSPREAKAGTWAAAKPQHPSREDSLLIKP